MDLSHLNVRHDLQTRLAVLCQKLNQPLLLEKLVGDASTRVFIRIFFDSGDTLVAMCYPEAAGFGDDSFVEIHDYLTYLGMPVPEIVSVHPKLGIIVMEDLGDSLLETAVQMADENEKLRMYEQAMDIILRMVTNSTGTEQTCVAHTRAFDFEKLSFEMDFFVTHFVDGFLKSELSPKTENQLKQNLYSVCQALESEPRFFVHRDYHSRNLMIRHNKLVMIDFQDARMGPVQYDIVSLLRDSYVTLTDSLIHTLIDGFLRQAGRVVSQSHERFSHVFNLMALQRNLKALGTFGYQTSVVGSTRYVSSINRTIGYLEQNLIKNPRIIPDPELIMDLVISRTITLSGQSLDPTTKPFSV